MSVQKNYLPNPVVIYNFFTQPKEKYCITKIIVGKSKVDCSNRTNYSSGDENTGVIGILDDEI